MPNKKKNKPNAYFTYMKMRKPYIEKKLGRSMSYEEVTKYVKMEWENMTLQEKAKYGPPKNHIPLDCFGVPLYVHQQEAERKKKDHEEMLRGIEALVDFHVKSQAMEKLEFLVVATTDYVTTDELQVFPAEISVLRVTLGGGLDSKQYHAILKPPRSFPIAYGAIMRSNVSATHRLPFDRSSPDCVGADDFALVAGELRSFMFQDDGGKDPAPIYTLSEHREIASLVLSQAFDLDDVKVWSLEELLAKTFVGLFPELTGFYSAVHAHDDIELSPARPLYHPALGCVWHHEKEPHAMEYCSLNMAQRWAFMFLHALRLDSSLQLELVPGRHNPGPYNCGGTVVQMSDRQSKKSQRKRMSNLGSSASGSDFSLYSLISNEQPRGVDVAVKQAPLCKEPSSRNEDLEEQGAKGNKSDNSWRKFYDPLNRYEFPREYDDSPDVSSLSSFPSLGGGSRKTAVKAKHQHSNVLGVDHNNASAGKGLDSKGESKAAVSKQDKSTSQKKPSSGKRSENVDANSEVSLASVAKYFGNMNI